jgi:hypothetical protein
MTGELAATVNLLHRMVVTIGLETISNSLPTTLHRLSTFSFCIGFTHTQTQEYWFISRGDGIGGFSSAPETATPPSHGDAMNFWDDFEGRAESTGDLWRRNCQGRLLGRFMTSYSLLGGSNIITSDQAKESLGSTS